MADCSEPNTELWVSQAQAGDRSAFQKIFVEHRADVARLVFRMIGPRPELEDLVQDVFVQVYRSLGEFRGESRFSTWLHRLTVNTVLMHQRAARCRPSLANPLHDDLQDGSPSPDDDAIRRERVRAFYALLDQLPDKKRTVFVLHELQGMSPIEIAEMVGAPVLTVRTRLFYARRELIQLLRQNPALASLADVMLRRGSADLAEAARESSA